MTDTTETTDTPVKTKASDIDRLEALVVKIAKSIVKNPLTEEVSEKLHKVTSLIYSTITHSQSLTSVSNKTVNLNETVD